MVDKDQRNTMTVEEKDKEYMDVLVRLEMEINVMRQTDEDETICKCNNHLPNKGNHYKEIECIPAVRIPRTSGGYFKLADLINRLRAIGFPITGSMINIKMNHTSLEYINVGADPVDPNLYFGPDNVNMECICLKITNLLDENCLLNKNKEKDSEEKTDLKMKEKRTKERKIGYIISKVSAWRRLYNGFYNENGEHTRYSLDQAAKMIDISKKSLDDYLLQLRLGRKYGFDFNKNQNEKVGTLRNFVKLNREHDNKERKSK